MKTLSQIRELGVRKSSVNEFLWRQLCDIRLYPADKPKEGEEVLGWQLNGKPMWVDYKYGVFRDLLRRILVIRYWMRPPELDFAKTEGLVCPKCKKRSRGGRCLECGAFLSGK